MDGKPTVLFLCVHNAGRSQMALGFFEHLAGDAAVAWSGGSEPGSEVNPTAVDAMRERGIDISREFPKPWTAQIVRAADVVITMGCGDACPVFPGKRYEEWTLDDPAGLGSSSGSEPCWLSWTSPSRSKRCNALATSSNSRRRSRRCSSRTRRRRASRFPPFGRLV